MKKLIIFVLVFCLCASVASASIITNVDRTRGTSGNRSPIGVFTPNTDPLASNPLKDGEIVFSDRDYPYIATPASMVGYEYVRTFNTDKHNRCIMVNYAVTISEPAVLWISIDDRIPAEYKTDGGGDQPDEQVFVSQQEAVDLIVHSWAAPGTFVDTGLDLTIDEGGGRPMSVYMTGLLDAGTYDFGLNPTGKNFYAIGTVPEPATIALLGFGGLALIRRRKRS